MELARLELGGLVPVAEGKQASVLRLVKEAFARLRCGSDRNCARVAANGSRGRSGGRAGNY